MRTAAPPAEAERPLQGLANNAAEEEQAGMSHVCGSHATVLRCGAHEQIPHVRGG